MSLKSEAGFVLTAQNKTAMAFGQVSRELRGLGGLAKSTAMSFGGLKAAFGGAAVMGFARSVISAGDEIGDLAERTGMGVESIQSLKIVADDVGIRVDRLTGLFTDLQGAMAQALEEGGEKGRDAFAKLGVSMDMLRAGNVERVFETLAQNMRTGAGDATVSAAAHQLLGASVEKLAPIFRAAAGGMAGLNDEMKRNGEIFSQEQIERLGHAERQLARMNNQLKVAAVDFVEWSNTGALRYITGVPDMMNAAGRKAAEAKSMTPRQLEEAGIGEPRGPRAPRRMNPDTDYSGMLGALNQAGTEATGLPPIEVRAADAETWNRVIDRLDKLIVATKAQPAVVGL